MVKRDYILQLNDLAIGYKTPLAKNITLSAVRGQLISLIGPNGVGKTTFLKTICGLLRPISGKITLNDQDLRSFSNKELAQQISLVLTDKIAIGNLSVYELVKMGRYPHTSWLGRLNEEDEEKIEEAIAICGIEYLKNSSLDQVSDGQLQKAIIARALAQDGELLIFDEPTAHLDANNRFEVFHLLQKLTREHDKTILISTHQIELANTVSDLLWCMQCGKKIQESPTKELHENELILAMFPYLKHLHRTNGND